MGQFYSVPVLKLAKVLEAINSKVAIKEPTLSDLNDIIDAFTPPNDIVPFQPRTDLQLAIMDALSAAAEQAEYNFEAKYGYKISRYYTDHGAVLGYLKNGDINTIINQITDDLTRWDLNKISAPRIAELIQLQVENSRNTPGTTYGEVDDIAWIISYGIFSTSNNDGVMDQAVIYGFCAGLKMAAQPYTL